MMKELGVNFHDEENPFSDDPADDDVTLHRAVRPYPCNPFTIETEPRLLQGSMQ
jgi:hypothetical protein